MGRYLLPNSRLPHTLPADCRASVDNAIAVTLGFATESPEIGDDSEQPSNSQSFFDFHFVELVISAGGVL